MRRTAICAFLALLLPAIAEAKKAHCTLRAHVEANANDGAVFSTQMRSAITGKSIVLEKIPTISERDVVAFAVYQAVDGSYGVLFQLDEHGKLALDTLSVDRRGRLLYVFVNGRALSEMQIDRRITDGRLYIASGLTKGDLALMRKDWPLIGERKK